MKELIRALAGGVAVGVANVIPGVSGGTMMAIMNIFDRTMNAISDVFKKDNKNRVKDILFLAEVLLGAAVGILGFSKLLEWMFAVIPMPTVFLFVGLVALSIPVFKKTQMEGVSLQWGSLAAGAAIVLALTVAKCIIGEKPETAWELPDFSVLNCGLLAAAGCVSGFAMLLPGVSGSLVLMILGLYETVWFGYVNNVSDVLKNLSLDTIVKFIPAGFFAIGMVAGIVLSAKLTAVMLKKNKRATLNFLLGLVAASTVSILAINTQKYTTDIVMILGSVVAFAVGGTVVWFLGKYTKE